MAAFPAEPMERMQLALLLAGAGLDDEAAGHLRELIRRHPNLSGAYNNLAVILARSGETVEAAALLRRALEIDPAYADARANLEALAGAATAAP